MMGSCVTEAAQDVGGLHHRPLSATANHLRGPQQQPLVNNQSPHSQHALYSSHHQQPQHSHSHLQHHGPHPYTASSMGSYSAGGSMQPLSQHHAAPTSQHNMRGHSMSHMTSSSSSAGSNSFMDSGPVGYAASPPSSNGSSTTMAPPPLLPLPMSLSPRHGQQQQQHQHQHHQHQHQHQLGQQTDESTNAGFLQQLLHGGMPTDEDLVSVGGASLSLMAATYHGQQSQQQPQQQPQQQMGYGSGGGQPHSHSHNPTPASTGTPTNSSEELPCIFDELDMFQENPNSLVSPSCFSHHPATVPPQHHHAGAMEPGSGTNNSLQLLTITSAPPPLPTADSMSLERAGGRRRKVGDLYGDMNTVGISNGDSAATADGVSHGRRGSHPGHGAKRIRYNRSRSASCSSAAAVKPEPEEFAALASPSSSSSSSAAAPAETSNIDLEEIYVGVRDQVVYWGNSKNKYDVTVCVRAPTRYCGLLKGATVSYQVSLPAMQEFKMKSRSGAKGKGKPKAETVKKAVLQLVRTESDNGVVEFEAFLKNCLPMEKLSNLTLLELHFNITLKQRAAMGKAGSEEIKASFNLGSSASSSAVRGGRRKQSVGGDDDDFEDEEDGRESLDEDEYVPTARGRGGRGGRGKANGRGGQRGKATHQRDEELESDDPAVGGMDYHQFDMAFAAADGLASIERKVPVVTYTHSKAITRALCRLIWYPMNEENTMSTDFLLEKLCKYFASQLQLPISIYDRHNLAAMLSPFTNGITYVEFYSLLGEWFVLAIKMAKKKTQCLWQQGRETFIPLLFNPYRRINNDSAATASAAGGSSSASNNNGGGDDDEWNEDNEASSESTRRTGRGRGRRSRSGSRAGLPQPTAKSTTVEDCASDVIAALQLDAVLEREGDFLVTIGPDLKERHGRAEGEEGRGVNYFPSLKYPLQIVYVKADGEKQCLSVENKLDKLTDFIHAKQCLRDYLVLQRDGVWKRVEKDQFAFNHAQQRRLEETLGRTSVLAREDSESLSYAHA